MFNESMLVVFGAGGHAKVVIDAAEKQGGRQIMVVDDAEAYWGAQLMGYSIHRGREALLKSDRRAFAIPAIGNNKARAQVAAWLEANGFVLTIVTHPSAQVGRGVHIGRGSILVGGAVINSDTLIGNNVIINTGATVDHDCSIGDNVHIAPGVNVCGEVEIGAGSFLGVGAVVVPRVRIGNNCMIGAGATVLNDVPDGVLVVGTPARPLRQEQE